MANTKVTKGILADDSAGIDQLHIENDFSSGMSLSYSPTSGNLLWANTGAAGISSSADANAKCRCEFLCKKRMQTADTMQ